MVEGARASRVGPAPEPVRRRRRRSAAASSASMPTSCSTSRARDDRAHDTGEAEWPGWEETYRRLLASIDDEVDAAPPRPGHHPRRGAAHAADLAAAAGGVGRASPAIRTEPVDAAAVRRRSAALGHDDPARAARARPAAAAAARVGGARAAARSTARSRGRPRPPAASSRSASRSSGPTSIPSS